MGKSSSPDLKRLLPSVALATFYVAVAPVLIVWVLQATGVLRSQVLAIVGVLALSLGASSLGSWWWKTRPGSEDVLFGDLILWGWLRRWRTERRLSKAESLLGFGNLDPARQAELLEQLASALEARDPYTYGHSRRVARYSALIAKRMKLPQEKVAKIRTAAAVHDVGKIIVPRAVLNKPGKLTDEEFAAIQRHAEHSALMVCGMGDDELTEIVRHHHERLDGTGYPAGIAGEEVPLGSRIIAVADTFDALTSSRPYRSAKSHKTAMDILQKEAGTQLDPAAVRAFCSHYSGKRALPLWSGLSMIPQRLLTWLSAELNAGAASTAKVMTAAAATALIGGAAVTSALPPKQALHADASQASSLAATGAQLNRDRSSSASIPGLKSGGSSTSVDQSGGGLTNTPSGSGASGSKPGSGAGGSTGGGSGNGSSSGGSSGGSSSGSGSGSTGGGSTQTGGGSGSGSGSTGGGTGSPDVGGTVIQVTDGVSNVTTTVTDTANGVVSGVGGAVSNVTGGAVPNLGAGGILPKSSGGGIVPNVVGKVTGGLGK